MRRGRARGALPGGGVYAWRDLLAEVGGTSAGTVRLACVRVPRLSIRPKSGITSARVGRLMTGVCTWRTTSVWRSRSRNASPVMAGSGGGVSARSRSARILRRIPPGWPARCISGTTPRCLPGGRPRAGPSVRPGSREWPSCCREMAASSSRSRLCRVTLPFLAVDSPTRYAFCRTLGPLLGAQPQRSHGICGGHVSGRHSLAPRRLGQAGACDLPLSTFSSRHRSYQPNCGDLQFLAGPTLRGGPNPQLARGPGRKHEGAVAESFE